MDQVSPLRPTGEPLDAMLLQHIDMWWRAANYLSVASHGCLVLAEAIQANARTTPTFVTTVSATRRYASPS